MIITVACRPEGIAESSLYDVKLERIGKGVSIKGTAIHSITISPAQDLSRFEKGNTLIVGLFRAGNPEHHPESLIPPTIRVTSAFVDLIDNDTSLDVKWRGTPAALWHVGHYVAAIVKLAPKYRLTSSNCYYFARLLVYAISLRHYSFEVLAIGAAGDVKAEFHDGNESYSISKLFLILKWQERSDGVLFYEHTTRILYYLACLMLVGLTIFTWWAFRHFREQLGRPQGFVAIVGFLLIPSTFGFIFLYPSPLTGVFLTETQRSARKQTEELVEILGERQN